MTVLAVLFVKPHRSEANPGLSTMKAAKDKEGWVFISKFWDDDPQKPPMISRIYLVGGFKHFLIFHNIWDNPSH